MKPSSVFYGRSLLRTPPLKPRGDAALARVGWTVLAVILPIGMWALISSAMHRPAVMPSPARTWRAFTSLMASGDFWSRFGVSVETVAIGFAIVVGVGIPLGIAMGLSPTADRVFDPYVSFFLSAPLAPLVPLLIAAVGIGIWSAIIEVIAFAMPILVVNTADGVRDSPPSLVEMARSFQASRRQIMWNVRLPAALPSILAGLRLAAGRAVIGMIVAELIVANTGLGGLISNDGSTFNAPSLYATVAVVVLLGLLLVGLLQLANRRIVTWRS